MSTTSNRVLGMVSGFDTETLVNSMMEVENLKLEKLEKERQYAEWEQEAYQEVVSMLTEFQSTYFDVLNSDTNITSPSSFAEFAYSVLQNNEETSIVSVVANADMTDGKHTINSITQLATQDKWSGNETGLRGITSSGFDLSTLKSNYASSSMSFTFSIGSNSKTITLDSTTISGLTDEQDLVDALNSEISDQFGTDYDDLVALTSDNELHFDMAGSTLTVLTGTDSSAMTSLGLTTGQASNDYLDQTLNELFGLASDQLTLEINGTSITLDEDDTIEEAIKKVNDSDAGVTLKFDKLNDKFTLTATDEGSANNIEFDDGSDTESFFAALFGVSDVIDSNGDAVDVTREEGVNAVLSLDGVTIIQSSNEFTYEGITFTLNDTTDEEIEIGVETDTDTIIEKIKAFVDDYNTILDYLTTKLSETKDYDYEPLTDDEKEDMTDDQIELWEDACKEGILRNATELETMVYSFRMAFMDKVSGTGLSMSQIGISTTDYSDYGVLTVDEDTLREALEDNYEGVVALFTQESDYDVDDTANAATRYKENGIGTRFSDILDDYVRTTRDTNGYKGILIEKVGLENDASQYDNYYYDLLNDYDDRIDTLIDVLNDKEDNYYVMFAEMESALSELNSQYSSFLSALGS